jgi:hypothetical protein
MGYYICGGIIIILAIVFILGLCRSAGRETWDFPKKG